MTAKQTAQSVSAGLLLVALAACAAAPASPPAATPKPSTAHQAAVSCKAQYDAWKTGPAKALAARMMSDLNKVSAAGTTEDVPALNAALHAAGNDARALKAYPMPSCADPAGYWSQMLGYIQAGGDNASTSSGLSGLLLAMAPLEKVKPLGDKLTAELKRDAKLAS